MAGAFAEERSTHLRLTLTGTIDTEWIDSLNAEMSKYLGRYEGKLRSLRLRNETVPAVSGAVLEQDVSLRGALYRALYLSLIHEDPEERRRAALALRIGLAAIDGRSIPTEDLEI